MLLDKYVIANITQKKKTQIEAALEGVKEWQENNLKR